MNSFIFITVDIDIYIHEVTSHHILYFSYIKFALNILPNQIDCAQVMFRMIDVSHTTCNVMSRDVSCTIIDENKMLLTASHEMKVLLYSLLALLRFLPAQQLLERHLAEGRSGRGPAD